MTNRDGDLILTRAEIDERAQQLAERFAPRFVQTVREKQLEPVLLCLTVQKGGKHFANAMVPQLSRAGLSVLQDSIRCSSYRGTDRAGLTITGWPIISLEGRTAVLLDDIVDSGQTVRVLAKLLKDDGVRYVGVMSLLSRLGVEPALQGDDNIDFAYSLSTVPPGPFFWGFGMDHPEHPNNPIYRHISEVRALWPAVSP